MCDVWRCKRNEIAASYWINALSVLKEIYGNYKVCFTGGEVFLKDDVFEIFEFCHKAIIPYGITTNGLLLNQENIKRLLVFHPLNINISLDSLDNDIYASIRGVHFLDRVKSNIDFLMEYIEKNHLKTKVFFKTVVNSFNLEELHLLSIYAVEKKVAGITFDPIKRKRKVFLEEKISEFEKMSDIDMKKLQTVKSSLIELKKQGYSILNSERNINSWFLKYNNANKFFCDAPLLRININSEGQIKLCDYHESFIGNIAKDDLRLVLKNEDIKTEKRKLTQCKKPCEYCIQRGLNDYFRLFLSYIKN
jgi:MoaA/NifB/PqqE/SkfB family radical SAM enzyme